GSARHPLEGVTVLEFATIIAVPLGASLLADLGARVIKVEPTGGGDPMRTLGIGLGAYIAAAKMNAGKESICVDLKSEHGQALVGKLIEQADVIIHNYRPGVPERLGIGYERARSLKPDIVHVSVNGYGPDGPSAHRPVAHPIPGAVCGGALMQVGSDWPPAGLDSIDTLREAARQFYRANEANPDPNTSVAAASATLLGLYARRRTGQGQQIFLSMMGANGYANHDDFLSYPGKPERPTLDGELHGTSALYRLYPATDGTWVFLAVHGDEQWRTFCDAAGADQIAADSRFADADGRATNGAELAAALGALFRERSAADWERTLIAAGIGCVEASTQSPGVFFAKSEQMHANGFAIEAEHALWGHYQRWGPMVTFSETPGRYGPGALAGEHTDALLADLGFTGDEIAALRASGVVDTAARMEIGAPVA
ncbi:MAG: CoA transferase, partial [Chloroflexi bacterium]|nr:CoA transferase [Chloroflexota bacterium]